MYTFILLMEKWERFLTYLNNSVEDIKRINSRIYNAFYLNLMSKLSNVSLLQI